MRERSFKTHEVEEGNDLRTGDEGITRLDEN